MRLTTVLALVVVATSACGRISIRGERWKSETPPESEKHVWLGLEPTKTDEDAGMFGDHVIVEAAPYTAYVVVRGEQVATPLRVHAMRLRIGDVVTPLHEAAQPLEAVLEPGSKDQPSSARVSIPLGDRLVWRDGETVVLEADATLPWDTARKTVTRELRAVLEESSGTKFEAIMAH